MRYAINAATGGFSSELSEEVDPDLKGRWGRLAYFIAAIGHAGAIATYDVRILAESEWRGRASGLLVANGRYAGGLALAPAADTQDHEMDVISTTATAAAELLELGARFVAGTHLESESVVFLRARRVTVLSQPPIPFLADGEAFGHTPVVFETLPGVLRVLAPPDGSDPRVRAGSRATAG